MDMDMDGSFSLVQRHGSGQHQTFDALGVFQNALKGFPRVWGSLGGSLALSWLPGSLLAPGSPPDHEINKKLPCGH